MTPFFMAWGMFWIVPCPVKSWNDKKRKEMLLCMPIIGLLIGLVWAGLCFGLKKLSGIAPYALLNILTAAILAATPWIMSGFIHLDGFMDCADAHLSRRDRDERLRILKDSRVGAFAVITLVLLAMINFGAWTDLYMGGRTFILVLIPAVSRAVAALFVFCFKPLEGSSYKKMHEGGIYTGYKILVIAMIVILLLSGALFFRLSAISLGVEILAMLIVTLVLRKSFGGMSGDISGSAITIGETAAIIALLFF